MLVKTRFRFGFSKDCFNHASSYNSLAHSSTGTRSALYAQYLPYLVPLWFHVLFHSSARFFFTFPSQYCFTIGHNGVFSLTRWSSCIHTGFHVSHTTRGLYRLRHCVIQDFHLLWCKIQLLLINQYIRNAYVYPSTYVYTYLGYYRFARRY